MELCPSVVEAQPRENEQYENSKRTKGQLHAITISPESKVPASDSVHSDAPPIWTRIYSKAEADDIEACSGSAGCSGPSRAHKYGSEEDLAKVGSGDQASQDFQDFGRPSSRSRESGRTSDMVGSHTGSSSWSVTDSPTSARLLRNAWSYVLVATLFDLGMMAVEFHFQASLHINTLPMVGMFLIPVSAQAHPSGSLAPSKAILLLYEVTIIVHSCSFPIEGYFGLEIPSWAHWLARMQFSAFGVVAYFFCGFAARRLREKFTGKEERDQIVSMMSWWFAAISIFTYQVISGIASHLSALSASNRYCELALGETCKHRICLVHGSPCSHVDIVWYHGRLNNNATAQWIAADKYIANANAYLGYTIVQVMLIMVLLTRIALGVYRELGPLTLTEQRVTRQEMLVLWLVAGNVVLAMAALKWMSIFLFPALASWIAVLVGLAWMIHTSTQLPAEEITRRRAVVNLVTTAL